MNSLVCQNRLRTRTAPLEKRSWNVCLVLWMINGRIYYIRWGRNLECVRSPNSLFSIHWCVSFILWFTPHIAWDLETDDIFQDVYRLLLNNDNDHDTYNIHIYIYICGCFALILFFKVAPKITQKRMLKNLTRNSSAVPGGCMEHYLHLKSSGVTWSDKIFFDSQEMETLWYCWWLKSCTTWDVWNPINNGTKHL